MDKEKIVCDTIYCFVSESEGVVNTFKSVDACIKILYTIKGLSGPKLVKITIEETNFTQINAVVELTLQNIPADKSIALDMTPGRKYMSAMLFQQGITHKISTIKRVYYQYLEDMDYQYEFYSLTPFSIQSLHDLIQLNKPEIAFKKITTMNKYNSDLQVFTKREIMAILNIIFIDNPVQVQIKSQFFDFNLFNITFSGPEIVITNIVSKEQFNNTRKGILNKLSMIKDIEPEIPAYNDFIDTFLMAGIFNTEQLNMLDEIIKEAEQYVSKPKSYTIALDTNCLIFNVPDTLKTLVDKKNSIRLKKNLPYIPVSYFVAPRIKNELSSQSNKKISTDIVNTYASFFNLHNAFNQMTLKARKFQIGCSVLNYIRNHEIYTDNIQSSRIYENDSAIIEEVSNYEKYNKVYIKLLSNDTGLVNSARTQGLEAIRFEKHYQTEESYLISWKTFIDLVYFLSIIFVDISIHFGEEVHIQGIWSGKNDKNWDNQQVKVETNSKKILSQLYEYLMPIRQYKASL